MRWSVFDHRSIHNLPRVLPARKVKIEMELDAKTISEIVKRVVDSCVAGGENTASVAEEGNVPVGISNRHIHLTREHVEALFGKGYELTKLKDLSQPGQFACKEQLTIVGPSMRAIEGVRVLGPERKRSQVEISRTDSYVLKVKPPVRESGSLDGSAPITIIGPKGIVTLTEGPTRPAPSTRPRPGRSSNTPMTTASTISTPPSAITTASPRASWAAC